MRILAVGNANSAHVQQRCQALAARGHEVALLSEVRGVAANVATCPLPDGGTFARLRMMRRHLTAWPCDCVHVHYAAGYGAWLAAPGRRPLVVSVMGGDLLDDEQVPLGRLERWLTRSLLNSADLVTSKSETLSRRLEALGVGRDRILPLVWGVDISRFRPTDGSDLRRRLGLDPAARVILSPRALRPFYNINVIIDAFARLAAVHADLVLAVLGDAGDPAYATRLRSRVTEAGLDGKVIFPGAATAEEMPAWYGLAEIMVSVPTSDGVPQSLLEAMACGCPPVVADLPHYQDWVDPGRTALVTPIDPTALAATISRLIDDPELRTRLKSSGPALVAERADLTKDVIRLEQRLTHLRRSHRPGPARRLAILLGLAALVVSQAVSARFTRHLAWL
ncbi:glycosyltransferase family 4 protein [Magnetospirillum moscoviense]|uniref:Glycosyltransferase n=1 Tax=Magnetospirillum moscoviense TaxID=1437059 RepID=A0A178MYF0_9PROT|nr:glycosyltransferase family 4 protein [Magnetospirillum moscoviense]OAN55057.1 hypothetical protein A6A05_00410 [Magnetospirillum moscoviense]